jgi:hypothetical protein
VRRSKRYMKPRTAAVTFTGLAAIFTAISPGQWYVIWPAALIAGLYQVSKTNKAREEGRITESEQPK